jgi:hypothetical protein
MRLSVKSLALAGAILWGASVLVMALANLIYPTYGKAFLELCASIYPGYHASGTFGDAIVGTLYAIVDGGVGGAIFGWLYNCFTKA